MSAGSQKQSGRRGSSLTCTPIGLTGLEQVTDPSGGRKVRAIGMQVVASAFALEHRKGPRGATTNFSRRYKGRTYQPERQGFASPKKQSTCNSRKGHLVPNSQHPRRAKGFRTHPPPQALARHAHGCCRHPRGHHGQTVVMNPKAVSYRARFQKHSTQIHLILIELTFLNEKCDT